MFTFFRTHQRWFLIGITLIIILSFSFFGTYSTFQDDSVHRGDQTQIGSSIDGSAIRRFQVQELSERLASHPAFLHEHLIENNLLRAVSAPVATAWAEQLRMKVEKARTMTPYRHPNLPSINAEQVWGLFAPQVLDAIAYSREISLEDAHSVVDAHLRLFSAAATFPEHYLKQILRFQEQQVPALPPDQALIQRDLALMGCHSYHDWFSDLGEELVAKTIIDVATLANARGLKAPTNLSEPDQKLWLFREMLLSLKKEALQNVVIAEQLQKADETIIAADVELYEVRAPYRFDNAEQLGLYLAYRDLLEKKDPSLFANGFSVRIAQAKLEEIMLSIPLKEVWQWQVSDAHWPQLLLRFAALTKTASKTKEERKQILDGLDSNLRISVDLFSRKCMAENWVTPYLEALPSQRIDLVFGKQPPLPGIGDGKELERALLEKDPVLEKGWSHDGATFYRFDLSEMQEEQVLRSFESYDKTALTPKQPSDEEIEHVLATAAEIGMKKPQGVSEEDFSARLYFLPLLQETREKLLAGTMTHLPEELELSKRTMTESDPFLLVGEGELSETLLGSGIDAHGYFFKVLARKTLSKEERELMERELTNEYALAVLCPKLLTDKK